MSRSRSDLIIDAGMCTGEDSEFYLKKGFSVVGIEANPDLVADLRSKFAAQVADQRLVIVSGAITAGGEEALFNILPVLQWGSVENHYAARNRNDKGMVGEKITVPGVRFGDLLEQHGIPHYLKVDIEGEDLTCLRELGRFRERPRFVSCEVDYLDFEINFSLVSSLWELGYRRFKIVPQGRHDQANRGKRYQDLSGNLFEHSFPPGSSGPFGDEAPGRWIGIDRILPTFGALEFLTWHDLHAAL